MYFESVFIKPNKFYINIYNISLSKKFMRIAVFLASKVGRALEFVARARLLTTCTANTHSYNEALFSPLVHNIQEKFSVLKGLFIISSHRIEVSRWVKRIHENIYF